MPPGPFSPRPGRIYLVVLEAIWLRTRKPLYYHQCRFGQSSTCFQLRHSAWPRGCRWSFQFGTKTGAPIRIRGDSSLQWLGLRGDGLSSPRPGYSRDHLLRLDAVAARPSHSSPRLMVAFGRQASVFWISAPLLACRPPWRHPSPMVQLPGAELFC